MYAKILVVASPIILAFGILIQSPRWSTFSPSPDCQSSQYTIRTLSYDPLIIHLENFIPPTERRHLLQVSASTLERSKVAAKNGSEIFSLYRTSSSTYIERQDPASQCIHARASEFQGYEPIENIEQLQVTAYREGQQYRSHVDWFGPDANVTKERTTTFFGILEAECENCGTQFPDLSTNWTGLDSRWCRIVDCSADVLTVLPVPGSALFWRNLHVNGTGDRRTRHSGLRLSSGTKTGVNIWTTQEIEKEDH